jgi:predicted amino acid dehydrogenase
MRLAFQRYWFPGTVSPITGLTAKDGSIIPGYVISIPMAADLMLKERERALLQIRRAVMLARNRGAKIVGLGALTSSLTRGGLALTDIEGVAITTGHAFTGHTVSQTMLAYMRLCDVAPHTATVTIVGAAGSIGSTTALLLHEAGVRSFVLVDLARKHDRVHALEKQLAQLGDVSCVVTDDISVVSSSVWIVTATNTPEALIRREQVTPGTVIVDDAQPSDVDEALFHVRDVLVASAGAVLTPGIRSNFPMGLMGPEENYCCLAEVLLLAHDKRDTHFVLERATLDHVHQVAAAGKELGFTVAPFQNEHGYIEPEKLEHVKRLVRERMGL